ncbi:protein RALF-like 22 [Nymphaea colorata]|nr:protein RALF-like 22 [Nymphaea colorata]
MAKARIKALSSFCSAILLLIHLPLTLGELRYGLSISEIWRDSGSLLEWTVQRPGCSGRSARDCLAEDESLMDTEVNRRMLQMQRQYISYRSLDRGAVPCTRPGASYYNCHPRPVYPKSRGCELMADCKSMERTSNGSKFNQTQAAYGTSISLV